MRPSICTTGRLALLPLVLAGAAALSACGSSSSAAPATAAEPGAAGGTVVRVVAAENFWGDITTQIGGSHVAVTSIITDPNADPHSYETDPKDAAAVSGASFVILNGVGYDDFATKLLSASPKTGRVVVSLDKVLGITGDDANPHLWYDPSYVTASAKAIEAQLAKADPVDAATFASNEQTFLTAYQPYIDTIDAIKSKYDGAPIAYTERVPGYFVAAAGLRLGTPPAFSQAVEDGTDPAPGDTATFNADIKGKKVKVLLYNSQVVDQQTTTIKQLAMTSGVPTVGVSETIPADQPSFQAWQIAQAMAVLAALGG